MHDRLFEAIACDKEVEPHWRRQVAELHGGQEHDAEMNFVDAESRRDGQNQRHDQDDCRENVENETKELLRVSSNFS